MNLERDAALDKKQRLRQERLGSFVDNMKLPVHRWFRFSAGFSAQWVEQVLGEHGRSAHVVLDPFAGSGTTLLAADVVAVHSTGIEAHPFLVKIAQAKLSWGSSVAEFQRKADQVLHLAKMLAQEEALSQEKVASRYPELIRKTFSFEHLRKLDALKRAWLANKDDSAASALVWLAITAILRVCSFAGTAQWQYILPNKRKRNAVDPFTAYVLQVRMMSQDMHQMRFLTGGTSKARIYHGDARHFPAIPTNSVDIVITSPPYANNFDYADALRFEMTFWGEVQTWGDLHKAVRRYLIVSSSQHASREKLTLETLLSSEYVRPIHRALAEVCQRLAKERLLHGGRKHYHTMIAAYFSDMAQVWHELRRVCKTPCEVYFVIGDSAPYGVYVPVHHWLGELAIAAGFQEYHYTKIRSRNTRWKNRKHNVPLQEGILRVRG